MFISLLRRLIFRIKFYIWEHLTVKKIKKHYAKGNRGHLSKGKGTLLDK